MIPKGHSYNQVLKKFLLFPLKKGLHIQPHRHPKKVIKYAEMNKQFRHKINSTMLFHRERPAALCPFLLKWKQSGEKKLKSMEPPPWQKIKKGK